MSQSTIAQKVIDHIGFSSAALDKAGQAIEAQRAITEKCAELIPAAVDALVAKGLIEPDEKEAAATALTDPAQVIEILTKTAERHDESAPGTLGQPTQKAAAVYNSLDNPFVGSRTPQATESDRRLFEGLGLTYTG